VLLERGSWEYQPRLWSSRGRLSVQILLHYHPGRQAVSWNSVRDDLLSGLPGGLSGRQFRGVEWPMIDGVFIFVRHPGRRDESLCLCGPLHFHCSSTACLVSSSHHPNRPRIVQALHPPCPPACWPSSLRLVLASPRSCQGVMGAGVSCFKGSTATRSCDSDDNRLDPRKKGYNPYAVEIAAMGDASPAPKSNVLLPLYIYPNPEAWTPLQQTSVPLQFVSCFLLVFGSSAFFNPFRLWTTGAVAGRWFGAIGRRRISLVGVRLLRHLVRGIRPQR
jgi:hypothetical protein